MSATCVVCSRPMADTAYACVHCGLTKPKAHLAAITDMTPAVRDLAHALSGHGGGTSGTGKPGSRLPLNLAATARLDAVQAELTGWVRHILAERGGAAHSVGSDPIIHSAWYLTAQLEWMRHRPEVDEFLADVAKCSRIVAGLAHGPAGQKYLGPCGSQVTWDDDGAEVERDSPCDGDVYARPDAEEGTCRECKARWPVAKRTAWLDGEVRQYAFRAAHIADAYGINVNTIRSWALRGLLRSYWRTDAGLVTPWTDTDDEAETKARGPRLHYVGDVLDLAAGEAARRAGQQAKRAAARAAEGEHAA
jgi:hypothetical protein